MNSVELKKYLTYSDGKLWWTKDGKRFGGRHNKGYWHGTLLGKRYLEHRLVWLYHHGEWPKDQIDHIDGNKLNNRLNNLREVSNQENQFNRKSVKDSSSKYKGVSWYPKYNKWLASYRLDKKKYFIGYYETEIEAAKAYDEAVADHQHKYKKVFEA